MNDPANNGQNRHAIRLRGPFVFQWKRNGTQQAAVRVRVPCEIPVDLVELPAIKAEDAFSLRRNFGKPTGLEPQQRVTLELSNFAKAKQLLLNSETARELSVPFDGDGLSVDVTACLLDSNCLEIELDSLPAYAGDVRLVIEG